jgi:phosphoglycolate phosphatase-like HAD superfamily hydrolase
MIKNILFDFDGVIIDSMKIKGDGFVELFKKYPTSSVKMLETYHYANGGVSRFAKIHYFFNDILHTQISNREVEYLAEKFARIIAEKLFDPINLISEIVTYIQNNYIHYNCHIVSGAEHQELNSLCSHFGIAHYFKSIQGSPTIKSRLIADLLENNSYQPNETLLIGDSINDYEAATANGIHFYGYNNLRLKKMLPSNYLDSIYDLEINREQ